MSRNFNPDLAQQQQDEYLKHTLERWQRMRIEELQQILIVHQSERRFHARAIETLHGVINKKLKEVH